MEIPCSTMPSKAIAAGCGPRQGHLRSPEQSGGELEAPLLGIVVSGVTGVSREELDWLGRLASAGAVMQAVSVRGQIAVGDLARLQAIGRLASMSPAVRPSLQGVGIGGVVHLDGEDAVERLKWLEQLVEVGASARELHLWRGKPMSQYGEDIRHVVELLSGVCQVLLHLDSTRAYRRLWQERRR